MRAAQAIVGQVGRVGGRAAPAIVRRVRRAEKNGRAGRAETGETSGTGGRIIRLSFAYPSLIVRSSYIVLFVFLIFISSKFFILLSYFDCISIC